MSEIISLIAHDNFIVVNRDLIAILGLDSAVLLSELASEFNYWEINGRDEDGWFYSTHDNIQKNIGMKSDKQARCVKHLAAMGLIEIKQKGMPAKRHFKINESEILRLLASLRESRKQGYANPETLVAENAEPWFRKNRNLGSAKTAIKNNKEKVISKNNNKSKCAYGEFGNVMLTPDEYEKLVSLFGKDKTDKAISFLDVYIPDKGYKSKSHYMALRRWVFDAVSERERRQPKKESRLDWLDAAIDRATGGNYEY